MIRAKEKKLRRLAATAVIRNIRVLLDQAEKSVSDEFSSESTILNLSHFELEWIFFDDKFAALSAHKTEIILNLEQLRTLSDERFAKLITQMPHVLTIDVTGKLNEADKNKLNLLRKMAGSAVKAHAEGVGRALMNQKELSGPAGLLISEYMYGNKHQFFSPKAKLPVSVAKEGRCSLLGYVIL